MSNGKKAPLVNQVNLRVSPDFTARTQLAAALFGVKPSEWMRRTLTQKLTEVLSNPAATSPKQNEQR